MLKTMISCRFFTVLIILILLFGLLIEPIANIQAGAPRGRSNDNSVTETNPYLRVVQSSTEHIILELTPLTPQFETKIFNSQSCQTVTIPGLVQMDDPDLPSMPVQGAMLGIPQDAQPTMHILAAEWTILPGSYDLCPSPSPILTRSSKSPRQLTGYSYERSPEYQINAFMPSKAAQLVSTGNLRSQRFAEIRFNPMQYNPVSGELRYFKRIQVQVDFNVRQTLSLPNRIPEGQTNSLPYINEGYFEDSLRGLLLNYDQARLWRSHPYPVVQPDAAAPQSQPAYKILVNQDGLYQVRYDDLLAAGLPVGSLDPSTFQLFNQSTEVAIQVDLGVDGIFNSGDYLLFYGQKVNTKYTDTNVYWLSWGSATGLRMVSLSGAPSGSASVPADFFTTKHAETDIEYFSDEPSGPSNDHWYWGIVDAYSAPAFLDFTTDINHLGSSSHTATVRGLFEGYAARPNHHTLVYLNGNLIDNYSFLSGTEYSFSVDVPQSYLVEGTNTLRVECPRDGSITLDEVLVNWFEIDYYESFFAENDQLFFDGDQAGTWEFRVDGFSSTSLEAYDLTNPVSPVIITGATIQSTSNGQQLSFEATIAGEHRYLAQTTAQRLSPLGISVDNPSSWKSVSFGADYIIITHASFLNQVQPLANFRTGQGYRVQVVDVEDVYDEFNGGVFSPEAIKSFLAYVYASWIPPAPSFVLLVGDGNYDFKNNYGWNEPNYIPPYLADVDPWTGEIPTDNRYVSVSGGDILPDLYIGRFPARTPTEAQTIVDKTLNYEQVPPQGGWNAYQTFVADNADIGGNFPIESDRIINTYVPSTYSVNRIYYGVNYNTPGTARAALQSAINQGSLLVHFAGHGAMQQWASEKLLMVTDLPLALSNGSKLPFILPMTCAEGYFVWPSPSGSNYSALGESIVRINGRGAIASWSPTGFGLGSGHAMLDDSLFNNLFNNHQTQLGYLTTTAKYELYAKSSSFNDLIETFLLFGDPALRLQILPLPVFLPVVFR